MRFRCQIHSFYGFTPVEISSRFVKFFFKPNQVCWWSGGWHCRNFMAMWRGTTIPKRQSIFLSFYGIKWPRSPPVRRPNNFHLGLRALCKLIYITKHLLFAVLSSVMVIMLFIVHYVIRWREFDYGLCRFFSLLHIKAGNFCSACHWTLI